MTDAQVVAWMTVHAAECHTPYGGRWRAELGLMAWRALGGDTYGDDMVTCTTLGRCPITLPHRYLALATAALDKE